LRFGATPILYHSFSKSASISLISLSSFTSVRGGFFLSMDVAN